MIVAIMQPYFFPYIGYFQLMAAVDYFVFNDDAQYIKNGWVNRNRILRDSASVWWTYSVTYDDHRLPIRKRFYTKERDSIRSMLRKIEGAYSRAPYYSSVFPKILALLNSPNDNIADFNAIILQALADHLGIKCKFLSASNFHDSTQMMGQERVIQICRNLGASKYINPIGGLELYENTDFADAGIELSFLKTRTCTYPQFDSPHIPFLSIIDVMMFNSESRIIELLQEYDLQGPIR